MGTRYPANVVKTKIHLKYGNRGWRPFSLLNHHSFLSMHAQDVGMNFINKSTIYYDCVCTIMYSYIYIYIYS